MATLGNTSEIGLGATMNTGSIFLVKVTAPENGLVTSITSYIRGNGWTANHRGFLYDNNGDWIKSGSTVNLNGTYDDWATSNISTTIAAGQDYYIGWCNSTGSPQMDKDSSHSNSYVEGVGELTYSNPTIGFDPDTDISSADDYTIYMTYTPIETGASGDFTHVNHIANANIESVVGVDFANILNINGMTPKE